MANKLTDAEKLAKLNDEKDRAEQLLHKAQENLKRKEAAAAKELDRQRTNRLCTHGGHLEMYLEEPELFTKEQICKLVDYFFTSNAVKKLVQDMLKVRHGEAPGTVEEVIESAIENVERKQSSTAPIVHA